MGKFGCIQKIEYSRAQLSKSIFCDDENVRSAVSNMVATYHM